jgi:hypothetical protein
MKNKEVTVRSSMSFPVIIAGLALLSSVFFFNRNNTRQYQPGITKSEDKDAGAAGMAQFFFNARKNPATNAMDYASMLKADQAVAKFNAVHKLQSNFGLFWRNLGPSNIGGRTRAILFDKKDPSGQTMFAGGVSGGLWKSVNGGNTWDSINDNLANICVSCIAQDNAGNIFIGTGEGFSLYEGGEAFSTAILGGGMFESTDDGATFTQLTATVPKTANNTGIVWAYTNRIAINPNNDSIIYAATNAGLMVSLDHGNTFNYATTNNTTKLSGNTLDVKISGDGQVIVASYNGSGYYAYPSVSNTNFTLMHNSGYGALPSASSGGRIEFAIAPSNSNYIYASLIGSSDNFIGNYMTLTGVSSKVGGEWIEIGPGGSKAFDPYGEPGQAVGGQGTYDNTIGISPTNPGYVLFAGTTLWSWTENSLGDSNGTWASVSHYYSYGGGDPLYVHPDMHAIVFNPFVANEVFIGCDGGLYKSTDNGQNWTSSNRNYNVTQFYAIACSPFVSAQGEGIIGGTQDNGTPYIEGNLYYNRDAVELDGGDGSQSAISGINPNAYYATSDYDMLARSVNLLGYGSPGNAYTSSIDSVEGRHTGCFVEPIALYENGYDTRTLDSMIWIADKSYAAGDTIVPVSPNGNVVFPYVINRSVAAGDTVKVQNRITSKIATGFAASDGVWIMMQAIDFADPAIWMPIGGPLSKPNAFSGNDPVHCLAWSPDGDALFAGTEGGQFFRFSNLDSIIDTSMRTGALWTVKPGQKPVTNPYTRVKSTSLTSALGIGGADILSISVDPSNGNNVIVTIGGYTGGTHVYFSSNALASSGVIFKSAQGNLPEMPVYGSVMHILHSSYATSAIVATEHGVYTTTDITVASPVWTADNAGLANTIMCAIRQQTLPPYYCNNSGDVYLGSHGRGAWVDTTFFIPTGVAQIDATNVNIKMSVYPNPMNVSGTLTFTLPKADKVSVTIYDAQGKIVKQIPVANDAPGLHTININSQDMAVGVYLATVTGSNFRQTTRFVVAR